MRASILPQPLLGLLVLLGNALSYDLHGPYFVMYNTHTLVSERLDPVMSPGVNPSNHVHNIFGANTFTPTFDFAASQQSTCNTNGIKADHSNYWYPALYFHDKTSDTYEMVPTDLQIYYHFDPMNGKARTAFPEGFKMISGNAMLRHNDTATNVNTRSIRWYCHGPEKVSLGGFGTGTTSCPAYEGLSSEIWFPFCYDGQNEFDPADPMAHTVFGQGSDGTPVMQGGDCPSTHPTPLPQLFMEFHHTTTGFSWGIDEQPFTLAQGDPLGFGMHADFVSGWEVDVLQAALDITSGTTTKCNVGESGDPLSDCFEMLDNSVVGSCTINGVVEGDPDVTKPGSSLPGCNPPQTGPQDATIQTTCAGYKAPAGAQTTAAGASAPAAAVSAGSTGVAAIPSVTSGTTVPTGNAKVGSVQAPKKQAIGGASVIGSASSATSPIETGTGSTGNKPSTSGSDDSIPSSVEAQGTKWLYQGCYSDLVPNRSIRTLGHWGNGNTADKCAISCATAGFKIAGVEFGGQCFCDNSLNMVQAKKLADSQCNMPCSDATEACGGDGALQVYAPSGTTVGKRSPHAHRHIRDFMQNTA